MVAFLSASDAPETVNNFVNLARYHYYDGLIFHRVISGFMIQGGCPEGRAAVAPATGSRTSCPSRGQYEIGSLAMANAGPNTNGSQFFVVSGPSGVTLPPQYSLFGKLIAGLDVLDAIEKVRTGRRDRPKDRRRHQLGHHRRELRRHRGVRPGWRHRADGSAGPYGARFGMAGAAMRLGAAAGVAVWLRRRAAAARQSAADETASIARAERRTGATRTWRRWAPAGAYYVAMRARVAPGLRGAKGRAAGASSSCRPPSRSPRRSAT